MDHFTRLHHIFFMVRLSTLNVLYVNNSFNSLSKLSNLTAALEKQLKC